MKLCIDSIIMLGVESDNGPRQSTSEEEKDIRKNITAKLI